MEELVMEEKVAVRSRMKQMRRDMPADHAKCLSGQICDRLLSVDVVRRANACLLYAAVRGEADLAPFAAQLFSFEKRAAYPRVRDGRMDFYEVTDFSGLIPGAFGIPEPAAEAELFLPTKGAVILVPGVAFMENGNRIGMGGGYYDRYLEEYPDILRIGIAYEAQLKACWEPDATDLPMNLIVTEQRVIICPDKERNTI